MLERTTGHLLAYGKLIPSPEFQMNGSIHLKDGPQIFPPLETPNNSEHTGRTQFTLDEDLNNLILTAKERADGLQEDGVSSQRIAFELKEFLHSARPDLPVLTDNRAPFDVVVPLGKGAGVTIFFDKFSRTQSDSWGGDSGNSREMNGGRNSSFRNG